MTDKSCLKGISYGLNNDDKMQSYYTTVMQYVIQT